MKKWEYMERSFWKEKYKDTLVGFLGEQGEKGWEAVHFENARDFDGAPEVRVIFKRPLEEKP